MEYLNFLEEYCRQALPAQLVKEYDNLLALGHPRAKNFPLMNPFHVVLIIIGYFLMILLGTAIMQNRKKFDLKLFSLIHNVFLVILSAYMGCTCVYEAVANNFSLFGNGVDGSQNGIPLARVLWIFYFSKTIEFVDTLIMILKKNFHQVTFLHVYHHATIFFIWWIVVYYAPGGDSYFSAAQNSFVHVLMYSYYACACLNIPVPWKRYITIIQMFQFLVNLIQAIYIIMVPSKYPTFLGYILFFYMITLLILFMNFYMTSGRKSKAPSKVGKQD